MTCFGGHWDLNRLERTAGSGGAELRETDNSTPPRRCLNNVAQRQEVVAQRQELVAQRQKLVAPRQKLVAPRQKLVAPRQKVNAAGVG